MRTTVKSWLKTQEKAKSDAQEKAGAREEPATQPNAEQPLLNGDAQAEANAKTEIAKEEQQQPPSDVVESEETPVVDLLPSIEVTSYHAASPFTYTDFLFRNLTSKSLTTTMTSSSR